MEDAGRAPSPCSSSSSLATADAVASSPKEFEESSSHGGSTHNPKKKVKFLCSFGGRILPRPADGKLRYVGGETRIVSVNRDASFSELMAKLAEVCNSSDDGFFLKYQLPEEEDLDSLVSVLCDDDVGNMMEEFDKLEAIDGFTRLRVFLFSVSSPSALECGSLDPDIDQRYVDALNGVSLSMSRSESYNSLSNYAENCLSGTGSGRIAVAAPHPMLLPNSPRHMLPVVQSPPMSPLGHVLHQVDDYQQQQQQQHQGEFYHEPYHQDHQFYAQELQQQIYQQKQQQQIYHPSQESQQQQMYHHHEQQQPPPCWTVGSHLNMHDLSASIGSSVSACRGQQAELLHSEDHSRMAFSHKQYLKAFPSSETYAGNSPEYNSPRDLPNRLDGHWPEEKPRAVPDIVSCQPSYTHHSTQQHYSMPVNYHVTDVPRSVEYGSPRFAQRPNHIGHSFAPSRRAENFQHNDIQHYPKHNEVDGSWHMPYQNHCDNSQQSNAQYMLKHYEAETTWHGPTTLQNIVCDETSQEFSHSRALQTKSLLQPAIQSPRFQDGMCTNEYRKNPIDEDNCRTSGFQKNIQAVWSQSCGVLETMEPKHDYTSLHAELYSSQNSHQKCCHQPCVDRQIKIQGMPSIHGAEIGITNHTQGMVEGVSVFERQYDRQIIAAASSSSRLVEQVSSHQVKFWPKQPEDHIHHACCGIVKDSNHFEMQSHIPHEDHVVPFMHHNCTEVGYEDKLDRARAWVMHSRDVACDPSFEGTCSSICTKDEMTKKVVSNGHSEHAYIYAHEGNPDASNQNAPFLSDKSNVNNRIELSVNLPNDLQIETYHCSAQAENLRTGVVEGKFANTNMGSPYTSHDVNATAGQSTYFEMPDSSPTRSESSVGIKGQEKVELSEAKTDISIPNGEQRHTEANTSHGSHASSHLSAKNISKKMLPESPNLPSASQVISSELSASNLVNKDAPSPGPPIYDKSPENSIDVAEPHDIILETGGEEEHHNSGKQGNKNDAIDHVSEDGSKKSSHKIPSEKTLAEAEINCLDTNDLKEQGGKEAEVESLPARTNSLNIDDKGKKISETSNRDENCKNFEGQEDSKPSNRDDNCVSLKKEPELPHEEKGGIEENRDPEVEQMEPVEVLKLGRVNFANDKSIPENQALAQGLQIIKNDDLEEIRELGSGTYGTVYYGRWKGSDVAIKRIKASCFTGDQAEKERLISDFWREACTLSKLHHPNVVAFYGIVLDGPDGTLATITEYMVNGSLKQVLNKKDRTIDRRKRLILARDAACGMQYLHEKNIVHFDLKCDNLLVNMRDPHRPICKIGDLGLSKIKQRTLVSSGVRGTLPWMAPELLSGKSGGMVTEKVDVYSFGIVMWELLTGEEPYPKMHCGEIIGGILDNTLRPPIPNWCDPGWRALMEKCWSRDPNERPSFPEIAAELRAMSDAGNVK